MCRLTVVAFTLCAAAAGPLASAQDSPVRHWRTADSEAGRDLFFGDRLVLRHVTGYDPIRHADTFRTYDHVAGFRVDGFITKGPGGKYPHHMGAFIGWNATAAGEEVFDFWHGKSGVSLRHREYAAARDAADGSGRIRSITDWMTADGRRIVAEDRHVSARFESEGVLVLDHQIALSAAGQGAVNLGGDPHHAGFQFRAAQEVADREKETVYLRPATAKGGKDDVWEECPWVACRFTIQGIPYTVLMSDHPSNPRPAVCPTRPYGRFGFYFRSRLEPGVPLNLRFRLVVFEGRCADAADAAAFAARHAAFAGR